MTYIESNYCDIMDMARVYEDDSWRKEIKSEIDDCANPNNKN